MSFWVQLATPPISLRPSYRIQLATVQSLLRFYNTVYKHDGSEATSSGTNESVAYARIVTMTTLAVKVREISNTIHHFNN